MIERIQSKKIKSSSKQYPVLLISGPRQSGKTTLTKACFPHYNYYNLEDPNTREMIITDPKSFVNPKSQPTIFDEVQRYPELLSYIQVAVDESKKKAQFILTGSQNILLYEKVSQTLAGRVAIFNLLPLSLEELKMDNLLVKDVDEVIWKGFYPKLYDEKIDVTQYYSNYISTYVERDVQMLKNITNRSDFERLLKLLAGRVGQILNLSSLASDLGVDSKTVNSWISILETMFVIYRISPYYKNFGKRVIKSPKIYFYDTGLLCYLLNIHSPKELSVHFARGSIFENLIVTEFLKQKTNTLDTFTLYYWRDSNGHEIDILVERGKRKDLIEVKSNTTFKSKFLEELEYFSSMVDNDNLKKYLVYMGKDAKDIKNIKLVNWRNLGEIF